MEAANVPSIGRRGLICMVDLTCVRISTFTMSVYFVSSPIKEGPVQSTLWGVVSVIQIIMTALLPELYKIDREISASLCSYRREML